MAEEPQELREYVINKIGEDGQPVADKSSENYTGKAQVQYPNGDQYDGDFKNGVREGEGTMVYGESGNKYEGQWKNNLKEGGKKVRNPRDVREKLETGFWRSARVVSIGHDEQTGKITSAVIEPVYP